MSCHEVRQDLTHVRALGCCCCAQGDDYILYCHPSKQKTPRSDRLRAWYHDMLRKARAEDGSVCHISTLWDTFFEGGREHRCAHGCVMHGSAKRLCLH
jgi:E1A/CREB-binding protein